MSEDISVDSEFKSKWKTEYARMANAYEKLVNEVSYTLRTTLDKKGVRYHAISFRPDKIKTFSSLFQKVKRKQITEVDLSAIVDLAGVRIICLYRSDLQSVRQIISSCFKITAEDTSRTRAVQPFGYSSDHYVVELPDYCKGPRYDDIKGLPCEIQVRTILMDAWASVSHHLDYKQELDIPLELRANFNALSGLFYVADTNFELFKKGIEEERERLLREAKKGTIDYDSEINLDTLVTYLRQTFPDHEKSDTGAGYSELLSELRKYGYTTIAKINSTIKPTLPFLPEFEKELLVKDKINEKPPFFTDVSMIRIALPIADPEYAEKEPSNPVFRKLITEYRAKISGKTTDEKKSAAF